MLSAVQLSLNMNRIGSCSIVLLPSDFDLIPVGQEGILEIQLALVYLFHASYSHNACKGQGLLTQAHFLGVGANFDHCVMASPPKTGGQHRDDPVDITTLKPYLFLYAPTVKDCNLRPVSDTVDLSIYE